MAQRKRYAQITTWLAEYDGKDEDLDWEKTEAFVPVNDRIDWLLRRARVALALSIAAAYFAPFLLWSGALLYRALFKWNHLITGLQIELNTAANKIVDGSYSYWLVPALPPIIMYTFDSAQLMRRSLYLRPGSWVSGGYGKTQSGFSYSLFAGMFWSMLMLVVLHWGFGHVLPFAWWHFLIAGGVGGLCVESSIERVADAINVSRNRSISRPSSWTQLRRFYTK